MKPIFTFILLLVITFSNSFAQISERYLMSERKLEVRSGPGANYNIIAEVPKGTQVYVISSEYGDWSTVQHKNINGFVLTSLLTEDSRIADAERAAREAEAKKDAARAAAAKAIASAEAAKKAAEIAARKAIAEAERLKREAEAQEAKAIADAEAAKRNQAVAARRAAADSEETRRAVEEANRRAANTDLASSPIESTTPSYGSSSRRTSAAPMSVTKEDKYSSWEKKTYKSGAAPKSSSVKAKYDYKLDNYLKINVGKNTEVVVKLYKMGKSASDDVCIRETYIKSNTTHYIKNIPAGEYYAKIAYGKDWRETSKNGKKYGTFTQNALYEKGQDILDFTPIKTAKGINIPSYTLSLDLLPNGGLGYGNEDQDNIDADSFNDQ
ncbi:SH3 domain-containing protein [Aquimarina sp. W85]|uniref:SH3 domain-containing protein n=1 Tax=Aquimarina rhodophyticola TaxID=3342246 RepID=UPI00366E4565